MTSLPTTSRPAPAHAEFAARLVTARRAAGLSACDLAARMGVGTVTVAAWEGGRSRPRTNKLVTLAGLVAVSPTWLLSGLGDGPMAITADTRIEALGNGIIELRQLSHRIAAKVDDLEKRLAGLKASA